MFSRVMKESNKYRHLFSENEWSHFLKLGAALHDPTEKREFFQAVVEGKQKDPNYEISGYVPKRKSEGMKICGEILEMLKGHKKEEESA